MLKKFKNNQISFIALITFFGGSGTKLLQAQLDNSKQIFTIPAYPLLYFYSNWNKWSEKYKGELTAKKVLSLIYKQHESLIDSRKIKGFNGLNKLGFKKKKFLKISKNKFSKFFLDFLENKTVNSKNVVEAIHYSYCLCQKKDISKIKYFLFHIHNYEYLKKFANDFKKFTILFCVRNPLQHFWRRLNHNQQIEKKRFDLTDQERIKNYNYLNIIKLFFQDYLYIGDEYKKKKIFIKFEDLKEHNKKTIKKVCKKLKLNYENSFLTPRFSGNIWWGDKTYQGFNKNNFFIKKSFNDTNGLENKFFFYEILLLEKLKTNFIMKFKYKKLFKKKSFIEYFFIFLFFLPSKFGLKLFFSRFNIKIFLNYLKNSYYEAFNLKINNYYFNSMYEFKWSYRYIPFLRNNHFKKILYKRRKKNYIKDRVYRIIYFLIKVFTYPFLQLELIFLYFFKIYCLIVYSLYKKKL